MGENRFKMNPAYSGGPVFFAFWGKTIFDVQGLYFSAPLPALRQHAPDRGVGVIEKISQQGAALHAEGRFVESSPDGREVAALALEGFPWQASVSIWPEQVEEIREGKTAMVNGQLFEGPGTVVRKGHLREISFAALGADSRTSVTALAASAGPGPHTGDPGPENFMAAVRRMTARGLTIRAAIKAAAETWPALFQAHLAEIGHKGGYQEMGCCPPEMPKHAFEAKVVEFQARGLSRGQAIIQAARQFPELHEDYVESCQER